MDLGDFLSNTSLLNLSSRALLVLIMLMILTGRLVPLYFYRQKEQELKAKDETIKELTAQVNELHELARAWTPILTRVEDRESTRRGARTWSTGSAGGRHEQNES